LKVVYFVPMAYRRDVLCDTHEGTLVAVEEQTLVIVKPDGVRRRLTGRILAQFEEAGLALLRLELRNATPALIERHYPETLEWLSAVGEKTIADYDRLGRRPEDDLGVTEPAEIGRIIKSWLVDYLTEGPIVVGVLTGNDAVAVVRKLCGHTMPVAADPSSIRGRYGNDSAALANPEKRAVHNLVHASGSTAEAADEIKLWFTE
jgi:nucleoside-diphosphate kinase